MSSETSPEDSSGNNPDLLIATLVDLYTQHGGRVGSQMHRILKQLGLKGEFRSVFISLLRSAYNSTSTLLPQRWEHLTLFEGALVRTLVVAAHHLDDACKCCNGQRKAKTDTIRTQCMELLAWCNSLSISLCSQPFRLDLVIEATHDIHTAGMQGFHSEFFKLAGMTAPQPEDDN